LHNISQQEFLEIKTELFSEGFAFLDGFNFSGASFDPQSISNPVNRSNPVKLKIINKLDYIDLIINKISKTKEIYQFYTTKSFFNTNHTNIKQVKIQVSKLTNIKEII
jgi:hypothetical protein